MAFCHSRLSIGKVEQHKKLFTIKHVCYTFTPPTHTALKLKNKYTRIAYNEIIKRVKCDSGKNYLKIRLKSIEKNVGFCKVSLLPNSVECSFVN